MPTFFNSFPYVVIAVFATSDSDRKPRRYNPHLSKPQTQWSNGSAAPVQRSSPPQPTSSTNHRNFLMTHRFTFDLISETETHLENGLLNR